MQMSGKVGFNDNTGRRWNTDTSWSDAAYRISTDVTSKRVRESSKPKNEQQ